MSLQRALLALDGLSVGDAFGEQFFRSDAVGGIQRRELPPGRWRWTDDTAMALGIVEILARHGRIVQDDLAAVFARDHARDRGRGYGATAHDILDEIHGGIPWRGASRPPFDGAGSMGNGSAMRIAPLGAFFADDLDRVVDEARLSAEVTHSHPEGIAGAIATAVAAASVVRGRTDLLAAALERTPEGRTRAGIDRALGLPAYITFREAVLALGNGSDVTCPDTVPFCLWSAQRHLDDYEEAMWSTVAALGDRDTTCAVVGGIVGLRSPVPKAWIASREPLPDHSPVG